jgi:uncharacterized protein YbaP (TraB family)
MSIRFTTRLLPALTAFWLLLVGAPTYAQNSGQGLLWRITGPGLDKPSFLFGTIHLICPSDYFWTSAMQRSLDSTEQVCLEMDMDDPNLQMQIAMGLIDKSGKQLREYFSPEAYSRLERFATDSLGTNLNMLQPMKPAALVSLLTSMTLSCSQPLSYETRIMEAAQKSGKEILGLEAASEQLELLDQMPADSIVKAVMAMTEDMDGQRQELNLLVSAYKSQDLQRLYDLTMELNDGTADMKKFLDERNHKWISRMERHMKAKPTFFAVGAGHLWGPKGVIALLREAGYTVSPVK